MPSTYETCFINIDVIFRLATTHIGQLSSEGRGSERASMHMSLGVVTLTITVHYETIYLEQTRYAAPLRGLVKRVR